MWQLSSVLILNGIQSPGVAAYSTVGDVTLEISEWLVYPQIKIVNYQFQNIAYHWDVPVLCDMEKPN